MELPGELAGTVFSRAEARQAGVSGSALGRRRQSGAVRRLGRGVWLDGSVGTAERHRLLAASCLVPSAVASHLSAARLWGVDAGDGRAHVTVPPASGLRAPSGVVVHRDVLRPEEIGTRGGLRVTGPYRTVLDVARTAPFETAVIVADALLWAERVEREELLDRLARLRGRRGVVRARRALEFSRYGAASPGETRLRLVLVLRGVPEPELQHPLVCAGNALAVDLCWPDRRLVVEYDGFDPHMRRPVFERDRRRWSWLRDDGWELRAYTAESVRERPDEVAAEVRRLLGV